MTGPQKFRTKPNDIEAMLISLDNIKDAARWCGGRVESDAKTSDPTDVYTRLEVPTWQGTMILNVGWYLIRDLDSGFWSAMTNEDFEKKYISSEPTYRMQNNYVEPTFPPVIPSKKRLFGLPGEQPGNRQ